MRAMLRRALLLPLAAAFVVAAAEVAFAPTPYTAQQIREATRVGRTYEFLMERPGAPPMRRRLTFVAVNADRATVERVMIDGAGRVTESTRDDSTWEEMRQHAQYPQASTTIEPVTVTTPAGTFRCHRYTVVEARKDEEARTVASFADDLPGPPVLMRKEVAGKTVMTMTLLRHDP
jgi:hypothetical protein